MVLALSLSLSLCLSRPVLANAAEPVASPGIGPAAASGTAHPQLPGSRQQGEATLRFLGMRIYHARLWTRPDFQAGPWAQQPLVLELEYLRNLKGKAIAERSLQEMRRGGSFSEAQAQRWLADMQGLFPDVKAGDRLAGQYLPGQAAGFWLNGRLVGQVPDADFARLFFGIWLAPTTSEPEMRQALLGAGDTGQRR